MGAIRDIFNGETVRSELLPICVKASGDSLLFLHFFDFRIDNDSPRVYIIIKLSDFKLIESSDLA